MIMPHLSIIRMNIYLPLRDVNDKGVLLDGHIDQYRAASGAVKKKARNSPGLFCWAYQGHILHVDIYHCLVAGLVMRPRTT